LNNATAALLATAVLAAFAVLLRYLGGDVVTMRTLPVTVLLFIGFDYCRKGSWWRGLAYAAFVLWSGAWFVERTWERAIGNLEKLPEWDYLGFWLHARTAVLGQNFYDPANAQALALPFNVSPEFQSEIVNVGFWYPPPSMFFFWPLGIADQPLKALPAWYLFQVATIALVVFMLWKIFFSGRGWLGLLFCAGLVCTTHGTYQTFYYSQTNFLALLAVLLFWRRVDSNVGGAWIAIAVFVKPLLALLAIVPLLARRWRVVVGFGLACAGLLLASAIAFGPATFVDYFTRDPLTTKPDWIYSQPTNQSLLGLVLRATQTTCTGAGCVLNPVFLGLALLMTAVTAVIGVGLTRAREAHWALSLFLLLGLIVYPVSQLFYSVLLIPPALMLWQRRDRIAGGIWTVAVVLAIVQSLAALYAGRQAVYAYLLMWLVVAVLGARIAQGRGWPLRSSETLDVQRA
jgi:Glycosyltransferase family 87